MSENYVCKHCFVRVIRWADGWKHATGGRGPIGCDKPTPMPERLLSESLGRIRLDK